MIIYEQTRSAVKPHLACTGIVF